MTRARDVMTREVICVPTSMSAAKAWSVMRDARVRHLPVLEANRLVGIVSDRDLRAVVRTDNPDEEWQPAPTTVGEIMTRAPVTCPPSATVAHLADLMITNKFDSIPIVHRDELLGLVTSTDLLGLLRDRHEPLSEILPFDFHLRRFGADGVALVAS